MSNVELQPLVTLWDRQASKRIRNMIRAHFLKDIPILGKEPVLQVLPTFDFHKLRRVERLLLEGQPNSSVADLTLWVTYEDSAIGKNGMVTLRFAGARRIRLPELLPLFYLAEVEVEDVRSRQLEGVIFETKDYGM